MTTNILKLQ